MNQEMKSILPSHDAQDPMQTSAPELVIEQSTPETGLDCLECIAEPTESKLTLKDVIILEEKDSHEDKAYLMALNAMKFEVKTKFISFSDTKIAVVKDQTVYENLLREKMLEKYQRMLLSSISHEIRNPLNAIEGYLSMMQEVKSRDLLLSYNLKVKSAAQQIDFIVTGACDLLLNDHKKVILQPQPFDPRGEIEEVSDIIAPNIESKGLKLHTEIEGSVPMTLSSDPKKYKLILFQLLANAVKYTHKGDIFLTAKYDSSQASLTTFVTDTGVGIKPDDVGNLFRLYTNIEKANVYNPQGMGLGLSLCKKLSNMLGGEISCSSAVGTGSTFTFTIKNYKDENAIPDLPGMQIPLAGPEGEVVQEIKLFFPAEFSPRLTTERSCLCRNVLIVDDEATNRMVIKHYLESVDAYADEAENGLEGIECVERKMRSDCCKRLYSVHERL